MSLGRSETSASFLVGQLVKVCGPISNGRTGTVIEVRTWGRYPVSVALDGAGGVRSFHAAELTSRGRSEE